MCLLLAGRLRGSDVNPQNSLMKKAILLFIHTNVCWTAVQIVSAECGKFYAEIDWSDSVCRRYTAVIFPSNMTASKMHDLKNVTIHDDVAPFLSRTKMRPKFPTCEGCHLVLQESVCAVVTLSGGVVDLLSTAPQDVNVSISHVLFMWPGLFSFNISAGGFTAPHDSGN